MNSSLGCEHTIPRLLLWSCEIGGLHQAFLIPRMAAEPVGIIEDPSVEMKNGGMLPGVLHDISWKVKLQIAGPGRLCYLGAVQTAGVLTAGWGLQAEVLVAGNRPHSAECGAWTRGWVEPPTTHGPAFLPRVIFIFCTSFLTSEVCAWFSYP